MKKTNTKLIATLLAGSMALSMAACGAPASSATTASSAADAGSTEQASSTAEEAAPAAPETVTVMTYPLTDESMQAKWDGITEGFETMYPGTKLNVVFADVSIEGGKLTTILNSGVDLPDCVNTSAGPSRIGTLAPTGVVMSLDELYEKNGWNDKIIPGALALRTEVDGSYYEIPYTMDSIGVCYNKTIFEELGMEVPTTYDAFIEVCENTKAAGYEPIALGCREGYSLGWMMGGILQSAMGLDGARDLVTGKTKWTEPDAVKAIETYDDWVKKGYISTTASTKGEQDAMYNFLNNQAAMYFIGTWVITQAIDTDMLENIGFFALPSMKGEPTYPTSGLGSSWLVPTGLESTTGAEMFINYILSSEFADVMANNYNNTDILCTTAFSEAKSVNPVLQQAKDNIAENAGCNPSVFIGVETKDAYFQNLRGLLSGIGTPEEVAANIQAGQDLDIAG